MQKRKWSFWLAGTLIVLWVGLFALAKLVEIHLNKNAKQTTGLNVYWDAPDFSFPDQDGKTVTTESLRGHVWIADFFFSQCISACPVLTSKLLLLQKQITSPNVRFISFSVDPEHDSPATLKKYAELWEGDPSRWKLLSTNPAGLADVAAGMKVTVAKSDDKDNPILHSTLFMLVDSGGQVRGLYDSTDNQAMNRLVDDARSLDGTVSEVSVVKTDGSTVQRGKALFGSMGCLACHSQTRIAPPLQSLYGSMVRLDDKRLVWADEAYLHESIVDPYAKVVAGYTKTMPNYRSYLADSQVMDLVAYIESLSRNLPGGHGTVAAGTSAPATVELLMDPVCRMAVTDDPSSPHVMYRGKTYFFCSDHCREQFLKNPEKYRLTAGEPVGHK
jgi:protein SCO1/2